MASQWGRSPGKSGSHFNPESDLFVPNERKDVITSTACWMAMASLLAGLTWLMGPLKMLQLYAVPYGVGLSASSSPCGSNLMPGNEHFPYVVSIAGICYVAGPCDLLASPWT